MADAKTGASELEKTRNHLHVMKTEIRETVIFIKGRPSTGKEYQTASNSVSQPRYFRIKNHAGKHQGFRQNQQRMEKTSGHHHLCLKPDLNTFLLSHQTIPENWQGRLLNPSSNSFTLSNLARKYTLQYNHENAIKRGIWTS